MSATSRAFLLLLLGGLVSGPIYGASTALLQPFKYVFKAGEYARPASLATLSVADLRHARRADNISGLLELAELENRIDPIEKMQFSRAYRSTHQGDVLLLTCLQSDKCLQIARTSPLHAEIVRRAPTMDLVHVNQEIGTLTERLMHQYFSASGWAKLEGQVGRAGIDGLYVKRSGDVIQDVLVVECKYNTSALGDTAAGTQMSHTWLQRKLTDLQQFYPGERMYAEVGRFVNEGVYRARLWNLRVDDDAVHVTVSDIRSKGSDVELVPLSHEEAADLPVSAFHSFKFKAPSSAFEEQFLQGYRRELDAVGPVIPVDQ
jgi:hypothetical protein